MRNQSNTALVRCVPWSVFGTLTFKDEKSESAAIVAGERWLALVRLKLSCPESEFYWLLRPERGESGGRVHLHVLLRVRSCYLKFFCLGSKLSWAVRAWRNGLSKFRPVDGVNDSSIDYIVKPESGTGADAYENGKTQGCTNLMASRAVWKRAAVHVATQSGDGQPEQSYGTGGTNGVA